MTYVIAKNKKTGSEQIFTEPVFRANESKGWRFVAYTENPNAKPKRAAADEKAPAPVVRTEAVKAPTPKPVDTDVVDSVLTDLQAQYKALTGKTANKNWGVPKITEEISKAQNTIA